MCDKAPNDDELRDIFAAFAISGVLERLPMHSFSHAAADAIDTIASSAFHLADAMVEESKKRRNT